MEFIVLFQCLETKLKDLAKKENNSSDTIASTLSTLELESDGSFGFSIKKLLSDPDGNAFINSLAIEVLHYENDHWGDILLMWLCGARPVPSCQISDFNKDITCKNRAMEPEIPFCDRHRCHFYGSKNNSRCINPSSQKNSGYCAIHSCQMDNCQRAVMLSPSAQYCIRHSCRRCVELGQSPANPSTDDPPKNVCEDHPMCIAPYCEKYPDGGNIYCESHSKVGKCTAKTKKGLPCKGEAVSRLKPFCSDHLHMFVPFLLENAVEEGVVDVRQKNNVDPETISSRCTFIKKKGGRCKGTALPGMELCFDHRSLSSSAVVPRPGILETKASTQSISREGNDHIPSIVSETGMAAILGDGMAEEIKEKEADEATSGITENRVLQETDLFFDCNDIGTTEAAANDEEESVVSSSVSEVGEGKYIEVDPDENEEGENIQHLREVFEINDGYDSDDPDKKLMEDFPTVGASIQDDEIDFSKMRVNVNPNEWLWSMELEERWEMCHNLLEQITEHLKQALDQVKLGTSVARNELQQAKIRAKAQVYENKSVIGGTMVGCISRLESIRATRPFAIIVEEASEVLEPLLFSCLSDTTMKMEMIGDHRQLSVSNPPCFSN